MEKLIKATQENFESSCNKTPQYLKWHKLFKREFTKFLTGTGATKIEISKPNHFDASGFFTAKSGQIYYFSIFDLRNSKDTMIIRTAENYKNYTGGSNQYASLSHDAGRFINDFNKIVK